MTRWKRSIFRKSCRRNNIAQKLNRNISRPSSFSRKMEGKRYNYFICSLWYN